MMRVHITARTRHACRIDAGVEGRASQGVHHRAHGRLAGRAAHGVDAAVDHVGPCSGRRQLTGNSGGRAVVRVHVQHGVGEFTAQGRHQHFRRLWFEQASHVLDCQAVVRCRQSGGAAYTSAPVHAMVHQLACQVQVVLERILKEQSCAPSRHMHASYLGTVWVGDVARVAQRSLCHPTGRLHGIDAKFEVVDVV